MTSFPKTNSGRDHPTAEPDQDLHIYYIEGAACTDGQLHESTFIGNWLEDGFSFLFFSEPADDTVHRILRRQPHLTLLDKYHMTYDTWHGGKVTAFSSGRFAIFPPWEAPAGKPGEMDIVLDPGVVFGTGAHATTRDCLAAIEMVMGATPVASAIDLGTGTGLLAIAAVKAGCRRAVAVDLNRLAAGTARKNVGLNGLDDRILVVEGDACQAVFGHGQLVIANIHFDVMRRLITTDGFIDKPWFILSGLMRSQAVEVARQLEKQSCIIVKRWEKDGIWHTFLGRNPSSIDS